MSMSNQTPQSTTQPKVQTSSTKSASASSSHVEEAKRMAAEKLHDYGSHYVSEPATDLGIQLREYARRKPEVAAMWCFGLGLLVGWKLRS
jgi:hypothetical protein